MITNKRNTINESDLDFFLNDPYTNIEIDEAGISKKEISDLVHSLSDKSHWEIDSILSDQILQINDEQIRNRFRRFLISEKYDILMAYPRGGTKKYCIMYADDNCILVLSPRIIRENEIIKPTSTIVLSPQGEVKLSEDIVYINENSITCYGFTTLWDDKFGLCSRKGDILLPCVFDSIDNQIYHLQVSFKGYRYTYYHVPQKPIADYSYLLCRADNGLILKSESEIFLLLPLGMDEFIHNGAFSMLFDDNDKISLSTDEKIKLQEENVIALLDALAPECIRCSKEELLKYVEEISVKNHGRLKDSKYWNVDS